MCPSSSRYPTEVIGTMPASDQTPFLVAVTGGIGSGKSLVAKVFEKLGAVRIDADAIAYAVTQEAEVLGEIEARFGSSFIAADGSLDRAALAQRVFSDSAARSALEGIIHPRVRQRIDKELARLAGNGSDGVGLLPRSRPLVLLDIPLLETSPYRDRVDHVIFIEVPEGDRARRVRDTRGWTVEELALREAAQVPLEEKRRGAHSILTNPDVVEDGLVEETLTEKCRALLEQWITGLS